MENDKMVRLEEMHESMQQSLENIHVVYEQQQTLLNIVRNSDKKEQFEAFCDELAAQLIDLNSQTVKLSKRMDLLTEIIDECKVDEKSKAIVLKVLDMFGIFEDN